MSNNLTLEQISEKSRGPPDPQYRPQSPPKMGSSWTLIIVIGIGFALTLGGLTAAILWSKIFNGILLRQLILNPSSTSYTMWKETPIPMYLEIHMFNWTNPEYFDGSSDVKPNFVEMGPYVFKEVDTKVNQVWNYENATVTFQQRRVWHFEESRSNGSLSDRVTNLNPVAATVAYIMRHKNNITKIVINSLMRITKEKLTVTKTVRELLFDGYKDDLLTIASKSNISGIPFDKFGWFYGRNESDSYDGTFNMNTGFIDVNELGTIKEWNYSNRSKYYEDSCGDIRGTLGDLWPPMTNKKTASVFAPDVCTTMSLNYNDVEEYLGVSGNQYVSDVDMLDNGTNVPSRACYCKDVECQPSGAFNVSRCKFGAPAFMSLPHFYLADESYRSAITGMTPDKEKHQFSVVVEPTAGIPMQVRAKLQLNLLVQPDPSISVFKNVSKTFIPMLWFKQEADLSESLASRVKFMLVLGMLGHVTFYGIAGIGILLVCIGFGMCYRRHRRADDNQNLLSQTQRNGADRNDG